MNKKMKTTIVAGVAALGIATAGVSWALFSQSATANAVGGEGGKLKPVTVTSATYKYDNAVAGGDPGSLFPGHKASVVIEVSNPNSVNVKVDTVKPAASNAVAATGSTPAECATAIVLADPANFGADAVTIEPGKSKTLVLTDAVEMKAAESRDECQGMKFKTAWTVSVVNQ